MTTQQIQETARRTAKNIIREHFGSRMANEDVGLVERASEITAFEFLPFAVDNSVERILSAAREVVESDKAMRDCGIDDFPRMAERANNAIVELKRCLSEECAPLEIKQTGVPLNKVEL